MEPIVAVFVFLAGGLFGMISGIVRRSARDEEERRG